MTFFLFFPSSLLLPPPRLVKEIDRNCAFFLNRYFQSRPEIFANQSDGSQAKPAVAVAMNRASDVTSKMVGGLKNAVASSRAGGGGNVNKTVSSIVS
jgi:hypothetical protein